ALSNDSDDPQAPPPMLVVYLVDPFTCSTSESEVIRWAALGLYQCYVQMLAYLPEHIQNNIQVQIVSLDAIMSQNKLERAKRRDQFQQMAFSVFYQCATVFQNHPSAKSLTGFGPAAAQEAFI